MKKMQLKSIAGILSLSMAFGLFVPATMATPSFAATEHWNDASSSSTAWKNYKEDWASISSNYQNVSLTPGTDESELNFAWYSKTSETPKVRLATNKEMTSAVEFTGGQEQISLEGLTEYYSNKVTVENLVENTDYFYQVYQNGAWQDAQEYSTNSFSNYSFLYVGDPQIGACKGQSSSENGTGSADMAESSTGTSNLAARNDSYNWNNVLNQAVKANPNVSFMMSAGDQVNTATYESEYAGYLSADALRSLPVATTIGNHDSRSSQYSLHYNNPNSFENTETTYTEGATAAGSDYYYTYGDVLYIVIDTNNYNVATHKNVINKAVSENEDAKWRVVMFHQDIYGSGYDHSDSDGMVLRTQLTPIMDEFDIDVVLQGHDHTYSRTYQLTSDGKEHASYNSSNYRDDSEKFKQDNNCYTITSETESGTITDPEGTVYLEANSATGSKFYELIASQQDYIAERSQTWTPSYSVVSVDEDSFSVTVYDATTGDELAGSSTYTIVKDSKKDDQTITGTDSYSKKVGDTSFDLDAQATTDLSYSSDNEDVAVVSQNGKVRVTGAGTATITIKAAASKTVKAATKTVTVEVSKNQHKQIMSGTSTYTKAYGSSSFTINAATDGDGALSYKSSKTSVATVSSSGRVYIKGIGTAAITVNAAATADYTAASKVVYIKVLPSKQSFSKAKAYRGYTRLTWKKDTKVSGYQVVYASNSYFTRNANIKTFTSRYYNTTKITGISKNKTYYYKVRSYKTINGVRVYGSYSTVKKVTAR